MPLESCFGVFNKLTHLFGFVLVFIGYFNFSIIFDVVAIFLKISYLTGQALVNKFVSVYNLTVEIAKLTSAFFQIVYEDYIIFINDCFQKIVFGLTLLKDCYLFLEKGVELTSAIGWDFFNVIIAVGETAAKILAFAFLTVTAIKQTLNDVGLSIWLFINLLPRKGIQGVTAIFEFVKSTISDINNVIVLFCEKIYHSITNVYLFFFDIPLNSIYGLIIGAMFLTLVCVKFKDICLMISSALLNLYFCVLSFGNSLWTGRFLEQTRGNSSSGYGPEDDERLCVVCQFRLKEIIILPCKHLCLCWDCSIKLTTRHHACPICRSHIRETLKVYL